jgi:large subunit ribosomal protein L18
VKLVAKAKKITVPHRRRKELKTNYRLRLNLLKSRKPRLVVRKSLNNLLCQVVEYQTTGDVCLVSADTKELKKFGWEANTGNIPAAYLAGLLCGIKSKKKKISDAVLDMGLCRSTPGSRIYAALRGAVDGGLNVSHSAEILPDEDRTKGSHVASYGEWLKRENSQGYKTRFSAYLKRKITPESLPKHFDQVKAKILKSK